MTDHNNDKEDGIEFKALIKKRSVIRCRLTKFKMYLKSFEDVEAKDLTSTQVKEIALRTEAFRDLLTKFDEVQSEIEAVCSDIESQIEERETTESAFYTILTVAQELAETNSKLNERAMSVYSGPPSNAVNSLKLPTIQLPSFDGNYLKWLEFKDTFDSLINSNETIPEINKFHYLRSSLEGSAMVVIKSIEFTSINYKVAWELLCQRYDNKHILINNHLKALFNIENITKESYKSLRYLIDNVSKNLRALTTLGQPTEQWDTLIIFMVSTKLDINTSRKWEEYKNNLAHLPSLLEFTDFLRNRANILESTYVNKFEKYDNKTNIQSNQKSMKSFVASASVTKAIKCQVCNGCHQVHECTAFKDLSINERLNEINKLNLCHNCFRSGHRTNTCYLKGSCRICKKKHNTLVHRSPSPTNTKGSKPNDPNPNANPQDTNSKDPKGTNSRNENTDPKIPVLPISLSALSVGQVLLCTALVDVVNLENNNTYQARALLDSGSQSSFITENLKRKLGLTTENTKPINISGINNALSSVSQRCEIKINSRINSFNINMTCLVVPNITGHLPTVPVNQDLGIPQNIEMADPTFHCPSKIDLLLGADVYWEIMGTRKLSLGAKRPILQESKLGWLVAGPVGTNKSNPNVRCNFTQNLDDSLRKFWEIEEIQPEKTPQSIEEQLCENHFVQNTCRLSNGKFSVKIPFKEIPEEALGDSYYIAQKRFLNLEKKLNKNHDLKDQYSKFMKEYRDLGHMSEMKRPEFGCYLPHHAVIKEKSLTTKLRTVFDASAKTSSGKSLNDIQLVGPVVQNDLFSILLKFRSRKYVLTGDIEKFFRQIEIDESQRHLQLILWRENNQQPIQIFQLNTVTYGTASAPYLSTRCLLKLSEECTDKIVADVIENDFYIDDMSTGAQNIEDLRHIYHGVRKVLDSACFPIRKFRSNCINLLEDDDVSSESLDICKDASVLGLHWLPKRDILHFPNDIDTSSPVTKRNIISMTSKIFDPLGLLCACIITAKIILQKLWDVKLDWDDPVPPNLINMWNNFIKNLPCLSSLQIPRYVITTNSPSIIELHCFVDASQCAYGSCVYIRSVDGRGNVSVKLLCAKARVAPLKPITIPRLELCAALLGARLSTKVLKTLKLKIDKLFIWTDSTVVLGWVKTPPRDLKAFVSNRVSEINDLTLGFTWNHVPTAWNPADLASRGITPPQLLRSELWWEGPSFLKNDESGWPQQLIVKHDLPELKVHFVIENTNFIKFEHYSNLVRLKRIFAYVLRFVNNCKNKVNKTNGPLSVDELNGATNVLIKACQLESFPIEFKILNKGDQLHHKSKLLPLNPFLDSSGVIRVGGRLNNSNYDYNKRHPVLIDSKHQFSKLLMRYEHLRLFHAGPQHLLSSIREEYWPISGRRLARATVRNCTVCTRLRGRTIQPIMGNLPSVRVNPGFVFDSCGVDFAGPFMISSRLGRGNRITKSYLCLFICLATKAVHLEVVSAMSTEAFILCLRRFVSRRGKPNTIYCDNGTNFVGANSELGQVIRSSRQSVFEYSANEGINFMFSPAYSPHFGGIWEAGIKSAKSHLMRIAGKVSLTFEELATLFTQIEAILNSRPLSPLSPDPNDLYPLTPGHFLIGRPLTTVPSLPVTNNRPNRYAKIEQIRQQFWERWRKEFVAELQQRTKWRTRQQELRVGDMVVLKEDNLPPLRWRLGRIARLYPGSDGVSRVADVSTNKGIVKRAYNKICPLPQGN